MNTNINQMLPGVRYQSIKAASQATGLSRQRLRALCIANSIQGVVKISNQWVIPADHLSDLALRCGDVKTD